MKKRGTFQLTQWIELYLIQDTSGLRVKQLFATVQIIVTYVSQRSEALYWVRLHSIHCGKAEFFLNFIPVFVIFILNEILLEVFIVVLLGLRFIPCPLVQLLQLLVIAITQVLCVFYVLSDILNAQVLVCRKVILLYVLINDTVVKFVYWNDLLIQSHRFIILIVQPIITHIYKIQLLEKLSYWPLLIPLVVRHSAWNYQFMSFLLFMLLMQLK